MNLAKSITKFDENRKMEREISRTIRTLKNYTSSREADDTIWWAYEVFDKYKEKMSSVRAETFMKAIEEAKATEKFRIISGEII